MKVSIPPAAIAVALVVVVGAVGFFFFRTATAGPVVEGTDSMPPAVRKAFMGQQHQQPKTNNP